MRDAKYGVPGVWSFVGCDGCGLVYLAEALADPGQGYPSDYSQHRRAGQVRPERRWSPARDVRTAFLEQRGYGGLSPQIVPSPLARLALAVPHVRLRAAYDLLLFPHAHPEGTLLDVGCGNGRFLSVMHTLGWHVHGIEPDERSAALARRSSAARIDPTLESAPYPPGHFDVVTMNHVLEHIEDPVPMLRRCFQLCRPGGLLGIVVPNWRALGHRLFRRDWYGLEPPRHVVMYEPRTLVRVLDRAGFHVGVVGTTSVREWASSWRRSWRYRTGRRSTRHLLASWGALSWAVGLVVDDAGEELFAWAHKPLNGR